MDDPKPASSGTTGTPEQSVSISLSLLDDLTTLHLASALELAESELAALTREKDRLAQKGGVEPERLSALDHRVAEIQKLLPALAVRFEQSRTTFPVLNADTALIQGRVFYQDSKIAVVNVTVLAQSPQGATLVKTVTDARGAFELSVNEKVSAAVVLEVRSGRTVLYTDAKPASLQKGQRTYREIGVGQPGDTQPAKKPTSSASKK
jgi:hypothetical protein